MWINEKTGGVFILHSDIRYELWKEKIEAPAILSDEYLATQGYMPVLRVPPDYDPLTQKIVETSPVKSNGVYMMQYNIIELDNATKANLANIAAVHAELATKKLLHEIDLKSIRSLREYVAKQPNAPKFITDLEAEAIMTRSKL